MYLPSFSGYEQPNDNLLMHFSIEVSLPGSCTCIPTTMQTSGSIPRIPNLLVSYIPHRQHPHYYSDSWNPRSKQIVVLHLIYLLPSFGVEPVFFTTSSRFSFSLCSLLFTFFSFHWTCVDFRDYC